MKSFLLAGVLVLTACSVSAKTTGPQVPPTSRPVPAAAVVVTPSPSVSVLGVKLTASPRPKPPNAPKATPKPRITQSPAKVAPVSGKAPSGSCYVGKPCALTGLTWKRTIGCTTAWLKNQRLTNPAAQCPPGWPPIP
jgi:hypothetical protein